MRGNVHKSEQRNQNDEESEDDETKELVEGGSSREGGSGDKQGSKVVSPAATAVTFDRAATGWTLPTYSPKLPTLATHTNMSMTEVFQRIGPVWTSPFLPLYKSIGGILSRMLDLMWNLMSNLK